MVYISEQEYISNEQRRLDAFAQLITDSGITLYEIAKGSRVKYDTLLRALRRKVIRPENEARIRYYINIKDSNGEKENQTDRP